jgi:hypothetical protein
MPLLPLMLRAPPRLQAVPRMPACNIPEVMKQLHAIARGNTLWMKLHAVVRTVPVPQRHD